MAERLSQIAAKQVEYYKRALEAAEDLENRLRGQSSNIQAEKAREADIVKRLEFIREQNRDELSISNPPGYDLHPPTGNFASGNTKSGNLFLKRQGYIQRGFKKKQASIRDDGFLYIYQRNTEEYKINLLTSSVRGNPTDKKVRFSPNFQNIEDISDIKSNDLLKDSLKG